MNIKRIGLDLAKNIFQIHAVDHHEHVVLRKTLRRDRMIAFFSQLSPALSVLKPVVLHTTGPAS
jgi:transposase